MSEQIVTKIDKQFLARLCADAISNLQKACETHPRFPSTFTDMGIEDAQELLNKARFYNDHGFDTGDTIAEEEELEFTVAILQGMRPQAYCELVDLITVWLRVGLHLDDYAHLSAVQDPRVNPEEVARQEGTPSERIGHEVQPRLGFEKGVGRVECIVDGQPLVESFLGPTLRGVTVTDDQGRKVMMQP